MRAVSCPERTLEIIIRATDELCFTWWPDVDKRCPHIMTSHFGSRTHCGVFGGKQLEGDNDGGVLRCEECLKAERKRKLIGDEKASTEALEQMKASPFNHPTTKWAVYQNHALDSANCGHLQFLAVGPDNTCKEAPEKYPADTSSGMGWRYLRVGWVDLETGEVTGEKGAGGWKGGIRMEEELEMEELDKLLCGKPPFDIWGVIEGAINEAMIQSCCLDEAEDRRKVFERVAERLQEAFVEYHRKLEPEHEWSLDNCCDIDSGVLLGVMNLMSSWTRIDGKQEKTCQKRMAGE